MLCRLTFSGSTDIARVPAFWPSLHPEFSYVQADVSIRLADVYLPLKMSYASALTTSIFNPRLRLLNRLRAGSKPIMTFMGLPSFRSAQIVAQTGLDVGAIRRRVDSCSIDTHLGHHIRLRARQYQ